MVPNVSQIIQYCEVSTKISLWRWQGNYFTNRKFKKKKSLRIPRKKLKGNLSLFFCSFEFIWLIVIKNNNLFTKFILILRILFMFNYMHFSIKKYWTLLFSIRTPPPCMYNVQNVHLYIIVHYWDEPLKIPKIFVFLIK